MSSLHSDESAGRPAWARAAVWAVLRLGASSFWFQRSRTPSVAKRRNAVDVHAWVWWVVLLGGGFLPGPCASAQAVGDSEAVVADLLGRPTVTRQVGDTLTALYGNGTRVVFKNGTAVDVRVKMTKATRGAMDAASPAVAPVVTPAPTPTPTPEPTAPPMIVPTSVPVFEAEPVETEADPESGDPTARAVWEGVMVVGLIVYGFCKRKIVRAAWDESLTWGISVMLVPGAQLIYISRHWDEVKALALWMYLVGLPIASVGAFMSH